MENLRNLNWWAGLITGAAILWAITTLLGVTGGLPFFLVGGVWGLVWSLAAWPLISEKNNGR